MAKKPKPSPKVKAKSDATRVATPARRKVVPVRTWDQALDSFGKMKTYMDKNDRGQLMSEALGEANHYYTQGDKLKKKLSSDSTWNAFKAAGKTKKK